MILTNLVYTARTAKQPTLGGREAAEAFETAALSHNPEAFIHTLERTLGISPVLARRIVHDALGEPIVVVAKAVGMASEALQRILLFLNPAVGRSVYRVYELAMLFETIDTAAALALVDIWRAAEPRQARPAVPAQASGRAMLRPTAHRTPRRPVRMPAAAGGNG
jgi:hypothetical protein